MQASLPSHAAAPALGWVQEESYGLFGKASRCALGNPGTLFGSAMKRFLLCALCFGLAAACSSARRGGPAAPDVEVDTQKELLGRRVYDENCHRCHPGGEAGLAPAINTKPLRAELIRRQIRYGHGAVPGFTDKQMSEKDLDALVAYVFTLRRSD